MPDTQSAHALRAAALLSQMTLEDKAAQMTQIPMNLVTAEEADEWARRGAGSFLHALGDTAERLSRIESGTRLAVPPLFGIDAVRGHAIHNGATVFPCPLGMACSWDEQLLYDIGRVTAREVAADGLHWTFSPLLCVARDLRWGRVDETFGEAPQLIGALAAAMIRGYQGSDLSAPDSILACAKHYLAYGESLGGRDSVDAPVTLRLIRELFLPPFAMAVRAGCATFMTAYHSVDGVPMTANRTLLNDVLKDELGFDGFVVTDWDNVRSLVTRQFVAADLRDATRMAVVAGNDMLMSTPEAYGEIIAAVREGTLPEAAVDAAVLRILTMKVRFGLLDGKRELRRDPSAFATPENMAVNDRAAEEGLVLLKNNGVLPLSVKRAAVMGPSADEPGAMLGDWTYLSHPDPHLELPHAIEPVTPFSGLAGWARRAA
jgi:beta-glucosidase